MAELTPEQQDRAAAENNGLQHYEDGRPKYHRHFAEFAVHTDAECTKPSRKIRVYVYDAEDLERHEEFITERERGLDPRATVEEIARLIAQSYGVLAPDIARGLDEFLQRRGLDVVDWDSFDPYEEA